MAHDSRAGGCSFAIDTSHWIKVTQWRDTKPDQTRGEKDVGEAELSDHNTYDARSSPDVAANEPKPEEIKEENTSAANTRCPGIGRNETAHQETMPRVAFVIDTPDRGDLLTIDDDSILSQIMPGNRAKSD